ncbi:hypothetical protein B0I35DRAFT_479530 [Stachybotrys elegans]|uniref:Uncharacterized protein n=1 Tax=Stachybotrys elegans TaxID=80388 RepID=A0A8K0SQW9_9HYPO|nr:hypothetical protein B0I35DRAFT_479530 [Stachybotrys elegans]
MSADGQQKSSNMNTYDPTIPHRGETTMTIQDAEFHVRNAYKEALEQLDTLHEMTCRVEDAKGDDLASLRKFRDATTKDILRLQKKINISQQYLRERDGLFHCHAQRLCTTDQHQRLRYWRREKLHQIQAVKLNQGEQKGLEEGKKVQSEINVNLACYGLEALWDEVVRADEMVDTESLESHESQESQCSQSCSGSECSDGRSDGEIVLVKLEETR